MQLYAVLILMVTLSAVSSLRCYHCSSDESSCPTITCPAGLDRCSATTKKGNTVKNCFDSATCTDANKCCSTDLCNGAITTGTITTGASVLMLVASAIVTVFL